MKVHLNVIQKHWYVFSKLSEINLIVFMKFFNYFLYVCSILIWLPWKVSGEGIKEEPFSGGWKSGEALIWEEVRLPYDFIVMDWWFYSNIGLFVLDIWHLKGDDTTHFQDWGSPLSILLIPKYVNNQMTSLSLFFSIVKMWIWCSSLCFLSLKCGLQIYLFIFLLLSFYSS